ncbi:hypothetical protein MBLNU457_4261t2 [Dothideomycetes sp. NU457]
MPTKAHLRQRHGSDALRLERFDRERSASIDTHPGASAVTTEPNTPMTPINVNKSRGQSPNQNRASRSIHTRSTSSSYMSPRLSSQTFEQQRNRSPQNFGKLPAGASTPSLESSSHNGQPIASYSPAPATWSNMPNKGQLAILALSRFVDFFQMAALQTYMVHQLKSFDPSLPDSTISHQAGVLQGSFTAAQIITSILWGRAADQPGVGRKLVLLIGLIGTGITMLGVGFSTTYSQAVFWRVIGGAVNVLGGLLVDPVHTYPSLFGPKSSFGGATGVQWMERYPYAVANMLSSFLLWGEAILVFLFLTETLKGYRKMEISRFDPVSVVYAIIDTFKGLKHKGARALNESAMLKRGLLSDREDHSIELDRVAEGLDENEKGQQRAPQRLPFRRIWTTNVLWTLLTIAIFDFHMGAFANLWILFLSTDREFVPPNSEGLTDFPESYEEVDAGLIKRTFSLLTRKSAFDTKHVARGAFKFSGGLAFPPPTIGFAMAIIGFIGVALQFILYPYANAKFGLMRCFRTSLFLFPLAYFLAPYIALLPSSNPSPAPASGFWVWTGITIVLTLQVAARTFALPASIILLNNSSPHPSVLATIHGLGQADSATFRTLGPMLSGMWYGTWLERGVVGMAWWIVAAVSAIGCFASFYVRNGNGHEILLPGEEDVDGASGPASQPQPQPSQTGTPGPSSGMGLGISR